MRSVGFGASSLSPLVSSLPAGAAAIRANMEASPVRRRLAPWWARVPGRAQGGAAQRTNLNVVSRPAAAAAGGSCAQLVDTGAGHQELGTGAEDLKLSAGDQVEQVSSREVED